MSDCPQAGNAKQMKICFKCGSDEHSLAKCPKRQSGNDMELPFVSCFVCNRKGHLASQCPQNGKGLYVNGGACKKCGSTRHLSKDCANAKARKEADSVERDQELIDGLLEAPSGSEQRRKEDDRHMDEPTVKPKRGVVKF